MASKARQKGYRTVFSGKKIFLKNGYIGANLEKSGRFVTDKDLFNLWDYLFIKNKLHVFVQFKTNMAFGKKKLRKWLKEYVKFGKLHGSKTVRYEIWNKLDNLHFIVLDCQTSQVRIERFI